MMRSSYRIPLDRYVHLADMFRYSVGGGWIAFTVPTRRPRTRWWQFWRPNPRCYPVIALIETRLSEAMLEKWMRRLNNPTITTIKLSGRDHAVVEFKSAAAREMMRREVEACLNGMRAFASYQPDPNEVTVFAAGRIIDEDTVELSQYLINGRSVLP